MGSRLKSVAFMLLGLFLAALGSFLFTLIIFPFWGWFEAVTGIESLGHSGPANWCFLFMASLWVTVFLGIRLVMHVSARGGERSNSP